MVSWKPPRYIQTEFLLVWAVIGVVVFLLLPGFPDWPTWAQLFGGGSLVLGTGFLNYAFHVAGQ